MNANSNVTKMGSATVAAENAAVEEARVRLAQQAAKDAERAVQERLISQVAGARADSLDRRAAAEGSMGGARFDVDVDTSVSSAVEPLGVHKDPLRPSGVSRSLAWCSVRALDQSRIRPDDFPHSDSGTLSACKQRRSSATRTLSSLHHTPPQETDLVDVRPLTAA